MVSLRDISSYASPGKIPIQEKDGRLFSVPLAETGKSCMMDYYPEINISREIFNSSSSRPYGSWRTLMIPVRENLIKRITRTFFESGFYEALNEARTTQSAGDSTIISSVAKYAIRCIDVYRKFKYTLLPHLKEQGSASIAKFAQTRNWKTSCIRCIVWHPNCFQIAVAGCDDIIRIYIDEPAIVPVLKCVFQKNICCMAWRPYSASQLAVGCQDGICFWTIDNNLHVTKPAPQAILLKHRKHSPVISVEWSSDGNVLASSSIGDTNIIIWNVDNLDVTILRRVGPPSSILKWSANSARMLTSTVGCAFRVWETEMTWLPESWTVLVGTIQSAAWSPDGSYMLFVTSEKAILYRLQFIEEQVFLADNLPNRALQVVDLSKIILGDREIGGLPQSLVWDSNGNYLAILFKDTPCVVVFTTNIRKFKLNVTPSFFLTGIGSEYPSYICFQSKNIRNKNTVLTIGWSTGRIQYFPFDL